MPGILLRARVTVIIIMPGYSAATPVPYRPHNRPGTGSLVRHCPAARPSGPPPPPAVSPFSAARRP
eukprot:613182-Hanusia_phi.AAC.1